MATNFTEAPKPLSDIYGAAPMANNPIVIDVLAGQGILQRGSVVAADGKLISLATETPFGVLLDQEIDTSVAGITATVDRAGSFKATQLICGGTLKVSDIADKLRDVGIFLEGHVA